MNRFNIMAGVVAVICVLNSDKIDKNVRNAFKLKCTETFIGSKFMEKPKRNFNL